ncbi:hypothetical protein ENH_00000830 [Eimeria necatrix]|uniref:Uncharacterized protein n=1 Tax=Eimeria necatrix TaxID=51315 RepID=U6MM93_9EIME|nr:hypothetical protein ENH_00000830 [Eimeria necatrix]CDJ65131.1 hypothetical protein ENH_00000830 [Eimeria necatrix]
MKRNRKVESSRGITVRARTCSLLYSRPSGSDPRGSGSIDPNPTKRGSGSIDPNPTKRGSGSIDPNPTKSGSSDPTGSGSSDPDPTGSGSGSGSDDPKEENDFYMLNLIDTPGC